MGFKNILVVSDNEQILSAFIGILEQQPELITDRTYTFVCSPNNAALIDKNLGGFVIKPLSVKTGYKTILASYNLVISAHCKQLFPNELVSGVRCVNIHPGYNPFNRGWYPQVFSILNGLPLGATIHEIDEQLDHGRIIAQEKIELYAWDNSLSAYNRVQDQEIHLLRQHLPAILNDNYETTVPAEEGNINLKKDFNALREIKLDQTVTFKQAIDRMRALSHPPFKNAYFIDPMTGQKIYLNLELEAETEQ